MSKVELFTLIEKICFSHSKSIVENLLNKKKGENEQFVDIKKVIKNLWKKIGTDTISVDKFCQDFEKVSQIKSELWKLYEDKLWVKVFNNNGENIWVPNVYDLLITIFKETDDTVRRKYFHQLTNYYYKNLKIVLGRNDINFEEILSKYDFEEYIEQFLPCVKLDVLKMLLQDQDESNIPKTKKLVEEVSEFLVCPDILREDCYKIIDKINCNDCQSFTFVLEQIKEQYGNLGHYYKLKLFVNYDGNVKQFNFFAKTPPSDNETVRNIAMLSIEKEEFFYSAYISKLQELGLGELVDFAPKVYFVRRHGILVLEDLGLSGYKALEIRDPSNFDAVSLGIKKLAKLHACSILLEEIQRKRTGKPYRLDEEYGEYLKETLIYRGIPIVDHCAKFCYDYFLTKFQDIFKEMNLGELKDTFAKIYDSMYEMVLKSTKYRNVLSHGDPWLGNVLFRLVPNLSCYLVDFQLLRYTPPLVDVLMYFYINTDKNFRDGNMQRVLSVYRDTLGDILKRFDVDIDTIYNEETFNKCVEEYTPVCIAIAIFYNMLFALPVDINPYRSGDNDKKMEFIHGDRSTLYGESLKDEVFRDKMRGYYLDLYNHLK